jgi:hypothetical protein
MMPCSFSTCRQPLLRGLVRVLTLSSTVRIVGSGVIAFGDRAVRQSWISAFCIPVAGGRRSPDLRSQIAGVN